MMLLNWPVTNIILWGQVMEGLIMLLILLTVDSIVPTWIFQRKQHRQPNLQQLFQPSLNAIDTMTQKNLPNQYQLNNSNTIMVKSQTPGGLVSEYKNKFPITNGSLFASLTANNVANRDLPSSDNMNIYLSLNNDFDSFASFDQTSTDDEDGGETQKSYHRRCASVTTQANDDFEFHQVLPHPHQYPPQFNPRTFTLMRNKQPPPGLPTLYSAQKIPQPLPQPQPFKSQQQLTSLSMNDLDLITELEPQCNPNKTTIAAEYKQQRMYRKRPRLQSQTIMDNFHQSNSRPPTHRQYKQPAVPKRRVLSLECLSTPRNQTDLNKNYFDVSYLDTGDLCLVRKGDGSRCIFVTDFI